MAFKLTPFTTQPQQPQDPIQVGVDAEQAKRLHELMKGITHNQRLPGSNLEGASRVLTGFVSGMEDVRRRDKEAQQRAAQVRALQDMGATPAEIALAQAGDPRGIQAAMARAEEQRTYSRGRTDLEEDRRYSERIEQKKWDRGQKAAKKEREEKFINDTAIQLMKLDVTSKKDAQKRLEAVAKLRAKAGLDAQMSGQLKQYEDYLKSRVDPVSGEKLATVPFAVWQQQQGLQTPEVTLDAEGRQVVGSPLVEGAAAQPAPAQPQAAPADVPAAAAQPAQATGTPPAGAPRITEERPKGVNLEVLGKKRAEWRAKWEATPPADRSKALKGFMNTMTDTATALNALNKIDSLIQPTGVAPVDAVIPEAALGSWYAATRRWLGENFGIPSEAGLAKENLDSAKAYFSFSKLQAMRDASPTGGALGQVTERELAQLERSFKSLSEVHMEPEAFRVAMNEAKEKLVAIQRAAELDYNYMTGKITEGEYQAGLEGFIQQWKRFGGTDEPQQPASSKPKIPEGWGYTVE